jgi:hypothetical protein
VDVKNTKIRAKTTKICTNEGTRTNLQRKLEVKGLNRNKGLKRKELPTAGCPICKSKKLRGFFAKRRSQAGLTGIDFD